MDRLSNNLKPAFPTSQSKLLLAEGKKDTSLEATGWGVV